MPGGIERHIHDTAQRLSGEDDVTIVATRGQRPQRARMGGVRVELAREFGRVRGIPVSPRLASVASEDRWDVVHLHCPNPTAELGLLGPRRSCRIATYHSDPTRPRALVPLYGRFLARVLATCDRVLVSSEQLVARSPVLRQLRDRRRERVEVVPLGVDLQRFHPRPTPASQRLRDRLGPAPVVLFVGRLRHYKGIDDLITAAARLDVTVVVVGDGPDPGRVTSAGRAQLGRRFIMPGLVGDAELPDWYRAADVFCLPSTSAAETFGLAALEAMACGRPVITTELGTATSVVNAHGTTGLVVAPGDPSGLAEAIAIIVGDGALAARMGGAARERAVAHYDVVTMVRRIRDVYRSAVDERNARA
ncbi:MAG TPA: glycosyltransferase [Nitriliruptorales bacterium]|nr:glycosyltransferase [Nitriliruptorales bacterium]